MKLLIRRFSPCSPSPCVAIFPTVSTAADWPTAGDVRRTNVLTTRSRCPWSKAGAMPRHAAAGVAGKSGETGRLSESYRLSPTVCSTRLPAGDRPRAAPYYGSSADDAVRCLDAASGKPVWAYVAEGPSASRRRSTRAGSISAPTTARLLPRSRGRFAGLEAPARRPDRRLPGNDRMISSGRSAAACWSTATAYSPPACSPPPGSAPRCRQRQAVWRQPVDILPGILLASSTRLFVPTGGRAPHIYLRDGGQQVAVSGGGEQAPVPEEAVPMRSSSTTCSFTPAGRRAFVHRRGDPRKIITSPDSALGRGQTAFSASTNSQRSTAPGIWRCCVCSRRREGARGLTAARRLAASRNPPPLGQALLGAPAR